MTEAAATDSTDSADAHITAAGELLAGLSRLPTAAHPEVFDDVQRCLQEALTDTDAG